MSAPRRALKSSLIGSNSITFRVSRSSSGSMSYALDVTFQCTLMFLTSSRTPLPALDHSSAADCSSGTLCAEPLQPTKRTIQINEHSKANSSVNESAGKGTDALSMRLSPLNDFHRLVGARSSCGDNKEGKSHEKVIWK